VSSDLCQEASTMKKLSPRAFAVLATIAALLSTGAAPKTGW
jgi:hypothetical protein